MATTLQDISQAWTDYVSQTIVVTVTSTGLPSGQQQFNPGEKVKYDLSETNGASATGVEVNNIRLHLRSAATGGNTNQNIFNFIVPDPGTTGVTAFDTATSTSALPKNSEQTTMFIETSSLTTLTAGENVTIPGLEVVAKHAGTALLEAHVHATLNLDQLFPPGTTGKDGTKSLTVTT